MIKPGVKGKCLTCPYFKCESETAWCYGNMMRKIYTSHITDEEKYLGDTKALSKALKSILNSFYGTTSSPSDYFVAKERSSMNTIAEINVLRAKKMVETLEKLLTKDNPSWCIFRKEENCK